MAQTFAERLASIQEQIAGHHWIVAEEQLRPLSERHPRTEIVWRLLGDCLAAQRRYSEAENAYDAALVANPNSAGSKLGLANLFALRSRFDLAAAILDRLPNSPEVQSLRRRIDGQAEGRDPTASIVELVAEIERAIQQDRVADALAAQDDIKRRLSALRRLHWEREPVLACAAYFGFNPTNEGTIRRYQPDWIRAAIDFDFVHWPRRVQRWIEGRAVADVGCGHGAYSLGFLIAGVGSYVGIDPVIDLQSVVARNKLKRKDAPFPCTPAEIVQRFPQINIMPGTFEEIAQSRKFDTILMHNVTEHLMNIDGVFDGLNALIHDDSRIIFVHHNYYCWNGHHQKPSSLADLRTGDAEQAKYYDWRHIRFDAPADHYIATDLNRIRLDALRALCARRWTIETWDERYLPPPIIARMTPAMRASFPEFSDDDLYVNAVFVVAKPR